jgi:succinate dehydrogenase flavin-adding protein (antitoxin of CptAB toxin-antitoxin module)
MKLTSILIKQLIREAIESNESKYNIYKFTHNNTGKVIYAYSKNFKTPESLFNNYIWHINNSKSKSDDVSDTIKSVIAQYPNWEEWKGETLFTDLPQLDAKLEINKLIKSDVNSINAKLAGVGNPGSIEKIYVRSDYILPPSVAGDKMYIRGDVLDDYPKVKVNKINSILNKTDNKVYYLVTNPSMVNTGRPLDSLTKISSVRKRTPDEERELKLQQEKSDKEIIEKFKAELDAAGNPDKSELINYRKIKDLDLRKKYSSLYQRLGYNTLSDDTKLIDYFYPKPASEELDKKKIKKFKAQLDSLDNPTRSELANYFKIKDPDLQQKYRSLYNNLYNNTLSDDTRILDYFYPEYEKRVVLSRNASDQEKIEFFKAQLDSLDNPTRSELINWKKIKDPDLRQKHRNLYYVLYNNTLSDNTQILDYFYPNPKKRLPNKASDQEKIEFFKAQLDAIGNPTKSELFDKYENFYYNLYNSKLSDNTRILYYFYPKSDKTSISEVWKLKNILLNLYKKR